MLALSVLTIAADSDWQKKTSQGLEIRIRPLTPLQMAAFYEARGFPASATHELNKACFMTFSVLNSRRDIVWLELDRLVLRDKTGKTIPLLSKAYWDQRWHALKVPAAARTAFRWTRLPHSRDLHADEPVGGNIAFLPQNGPFSIEARFFLGSNKDKGDIKIRLSGLICPGRG